MKEIDTERQDEIRGGIMNLCAGAWVVGFAAYALLGPVVLDPVAINIQTFC